MVGNFNTSPSEMEKFIALKATQGETKENVQGTNSDRKETRAEINSLEQMEETNIQPEQNEETRIQKK